MRRHLVAIGVCVNAMVFGPNAALPQPAVPDFSSFSFGWTAQGPDFQLPMSGPHQVTQDPRYPRPPFGRVEPSVFRTADLDNPILQSWVRDELKKLNEKIQTGGTGYTRYASCWPMGTPAFLLYPGQPVYVVQSPTKVLLIAQFNHEVRHVYLNVPHSRNPKPSWYGESVGHYEGDTLVVDTIAINDQVSVDSFRTPHTDRLHVVERYRLTDAGKVLHVDVYVEDEGAFTTPWNAVQQYTRSDLPFVESVCAENNTDVLNHGLEPMPYSANPDF